MGSDIAGISGQTSITRHQNSLHFIPKLSRRSSRDRVPNSSYPYKSPPCPNVPVSTTDSEPEAWSWPTPPCSLWVL